MCHECYVKMVCFAKGPNPPLDGPNPHSNLASDLSDFLTNNSASMTTKVRRLYQASLGEFVAVRFSAVSQESRVKVDSVQAHHSLFWQHASTSHLIECSTNSLRLFTSRRRGTRSCDSISYTPLDAHQWVQACEGVCKKKCAGNVMNKREAKFRGCWRLRYTVIVMSLSRTPLVGQPWLELGR
jgi:hypothetical protein